MQTAAKSLHLAGHEYMVFWRAVELAIRGMNRALSDGLVREYDEDAAHFVTHQPNQPHVSHLLCLGLDSLKGVYNNMSARPRPGAQAREWMGVTVVRDARDREGPAGATVTVSPDYAGAFRNMLGLIFQYSLVLAPEVEAEAEMEVAERISSGDSRVCYVSADDRAATRRKEVAEQAEHTTAERQAIRDALKRLMNFF